MNLLDAVENLLSGKVGVIPTDTLYGLVASALDPDAVERVYRVRGRDEGKPCIVLIADVSDLDRFGILLGDPVSKWLGKWWPGKVSVILPCPDERFAYLHRGTGTVAFRVPDVPELRELLLETGPLIAPSANPEGMPPATTIAEAEAYFGDGIDFSVDGGTLEGQASTLVRVSDGKWEILRQGAGIIR
jgi:L-threonylcarbamoyladenylate synthase